MYRFTIKCNDKSIGETNLEHADPTMGMHFGILFPSESYFEYQEAFRNIDATTNWDGFIFEIISNKTNKKIDFNFAWVQDVPEVPDEIMFEVNVISNEDISNN